MENPYSPPAEILDHEEVTHPTLAADNAASPAHGPWRQGDLVVMNRWTKWPRRCYITGQAENLSSNTVRLVYYNGLVKILIVFSLLTLSLPGLVLALVLFDRGAGSATITFWRSPGIRIQRQAQFLGGYVMLALGIIAAGYHSMPDRTPGFATTAMAGISMVFIFASFIVCTKAKHPLKIVSRGGNWLKIHGAGPTFLTSLPRYISPDANRQKRATLGE